MKKGFTLVEIMIVVAIIGILVAIAVPGFIKARTESQAKACMENQQKVDGAAQNYYLEENTTSLVTTPDLVGADSYLQSTPLCPTTNDMIVAPAHDGTAECPTNITEHERPS